MFLLTFKEEVRLREANAQVLWCIKSCDSPLFEKEYYIVFGAKEYMAIRYHLSIYLLYGRKN